MTGILAAALNTELSVDYKCKQPLQSQNHGQCDSPLVDLYVDVQNEIQNVLLIQK